MALSLIPRDHLLFSLLALLVLCVGLTCCTDDAILLLRSVAVFVTGLGDPAGQRWSAWDSVQEPLDFAHLAGAWHCVKFYGTTTKKSYTT